MFSIACRNMLHAASSHSFRHRIGLADHASRLSISRASQPLVGSTLSAYANHGFALDDISKRRRFAPPTSLASGISRLSVTVRALYARNYASNEGERLSEIRNLTRGIIPADGDDRS